MSHQRYCDMRSDMNSKQSNPKGYSALPLGSGQRGHQAPHMKTEMGNSGIAPLVKPPG